LNVERFLRDDRRARQMAFFRQHDSFRCLLRVDINCPLELVDWFLDVREGHHGQVVACKQLSDRPLVGLADELELATQELGLELQEQLYGGLPTNDGGYPNGLDRLFCHDDRYLERRL